jgi:hypothetical protein
MPPSVQSAFRSIAAWANSMDASSAETAKIVRYVQAGTVGAITKQDAQRIAQEQARQVISRTSGQIVRDILENSGTEPPVEMRAPVLFRATGKDAQNQYALWVGAGGITAARAPVGDDTNVSLTLGISASDGSFFFGAEDGGNPGDVAHRQILFDATNNVITFGSSILIRRSEGVLSPLDEIPWDANNYTADNLEADLASGVSTILAGVGGEFVLEASATEGWVLLKHADLQYPTGTTYTGTLRTALGITSNGIFMGYQPKGGGAFVPTVTIDGTTGNATFLGTIAAQSIISVSASVNGTSMGDIRTKALNAVTSTTLAEELSNKLNKSANDILSGQITFTSAGGFKTGTISIDTSGNATGAGIAITSKGIVGRNTSDVTFSINATTGAAIFKGDITGANGTFAGNINTAGTIYAGGAGATWGGDGAVIYGITNGVGTSAVFGNGDTFGRGVTGKGTVIAMFSNGPMQISNSTLVTNLNADYLDGLHASAFFQPTAAASISAGTIGGRAAFWKQYTLFGSTGYMLVS